MLTPRRRVGHEYLDDPAIHAQLATRSMSDVARSNALFGGSSAVLSALDDLLASLQVSTLSLLDVGTGLGDIPARVRARARERGIEVHPIGLDVSDVLGAAARASDLPFVRADARRLPIASRSVDVVLCSQVLHHFRGEEDLLLLRELDRVARRRVIVSDIRRSWLAAAGIWLASWPLRFHPVSRHDGVVSVLRGFTADELRTLVHAAVGIMPSVQVRPGFRLTACWEPRTGARTL